MRDLTAKQKKLLRSWGVKFYKESGGNWLTMENMPLAWYEELEKINDTEILFQNTEGFLQEIREEIQKEISKSDFITRLRCGI